MDEIQLRLMAFAADGRAAAELTETVINDAIDATQGYWWQQIGEALNFYDPSDDEGIQLRHAYDGTAALSGQALTAWSWTIPKQTYGELEHLTRPSGT